VSISKEEPLSVAVGKIAVVGVRKGVAVVVDAERKRGRRKGESAEA
jgi:hypothetical protein